jgi:hypothetical protein
MMSQLTLALLSQRRDETSGVVAALSEGQEQFRVFARACPVAAANSLEPFVGTGLLTAMSAGQPLSLCHPISPRLLDNLNTIQDIYSVWYPAQLRRIPVIAPVTEPAPAPPGRGVGCFFSGGVDSFYTFLKHREEITHLIFVHGFDLPLSDTSLRPRVAASLREAAAELNRPLIEVETNLREILDRRLNWVITHGAALGSAALLLSHQLSKIYLPASNTFANLFPTGSHPVLDPLWSTEAMEIVHDGCEADRVQKVAKIATCDVALKHLRVCWENPEGAYNCGRCEKCQRTMLNLHLAKALERCPVFDQTLDPYLIARFPAWTTGMRIHAEENLRALEAQQRDPELQAALRDCLVLKHHKGVRRLMRAGVKRLRRWAGPHTPRH